MTECYKCGKEVALPYHCHRCEQDFCYEHRLPEDHDCPGLKSREEKIQDFRRAFVKYPKEKRQSRRKFKPRKRNNVEMIDDFIYWHKRQFRDLTKGLIFFIIIISIFYFSYTHWNDIIGGIGTGIDRASNKVPETIKSTTEEISEHVEEIINPEPISDKTKDIEQVILKYTNDKRAKNLIWDSKLASIARAHSLDMVENDFFSHYNLEGEDPTDRAIKAGYNVHKELGGGWYSEGIAENIGEMPTGDVEGIGYVANDAKSIGKAQVESWMNSPGHRKNILNLQYTRIGIGCAYDGLYYICTQDFY